MAKKVWVKSLQCKSSSAADDVYIPKPSPNPRSKPVLPLSSCTNSSRALRDVAVFFPKPKPPPTACTLANNKPISACRSTSSFPTLTELPVGHSSRRVVEIIFTSSWSTSSRFPGRVDMLFRVHNPPRAVARFEEHRAAVRSLAAADPRCAADGNEMMRFHCPPHPPRGGGGGGVYDAAVLSSPDGGFRTFAGSGAAHESASGSGGGVRGTRSMLVCRVIAGRVREGGSEGESASGAGKGELVVFDERAVLPCFLIIYSNNTTTTSSSKQKLRTLSKGKC
ncbi:homeobox protein engrailed-1 [Iris pallida]|uniref:Homeobox protein engrailed-1 n=1 Tax=Iris pallida TaxID=29817 RepID=A0AAX6FQN8_IRIPA|nr:homeobox protein engrailed-1 [Iris pallida]